MSHFYGTLQGSRGEATRCGSKDSGITTTAAGWQGAIRTSVYVDVEGKDRFQVWLIPWQNSGGESRLLVDGLLDASSSEAEEFFFEHAGWGYDPVRETAEEGRHRVARELAEAEARAKREDVYFVWSPDWTTRNHFEEFGEAYSGGEPATCESCFAFKRGSTEVLASLSCIDDASPEYRRVVEAELALEAQS